MCAPQTSIAMTISDGPNEGADKNSSSPKKGTFGFMFMDCCSFVGLGLGVGIDDDLEAAPCASIALIDSDEDTSIGGDSSTVFQDVHTLDPSFDKEVEDDSRSKDKILMNEEETKASTSIYTVSTLTMEKFVETKRVTHYIEEKDEEPPARLVLLSENRVAEERTAPTDEEESKTLNTLELPPSLDTKTVELPPSLDTKTLDRTLAGLQLVDTTVGDMTQADTRFNLSNPSHSWSRSLYDIERVPSSVNTSDNDDHSSVSSMSTEDQIFPGKGTSSTNSGKETFTKRLFKGKGKILIPWSRNKKVIEKKDVHDSASESRDSLKSVPKPPPIYTSVRTIPSIMATQPPFLVHRGFPHSPTDTSKSTVPIIKATNSKDVTATTMGTNEDDCYPYCQENVPFDEPLAIERIRIGQ